MRTFIIETYGKEVYEVKALTPIGAKRELLKATGETQIYSIEEIEEEEEITIMTKKELQKIISNMGYPTEAQFFNYFAYECKELDYCAEDEKYSVIYNELVDDFDMIPKKARELANTLFDELGYRG